MQRLLSLLTGVIAAILYGINLIFWPLLIFMAALFRLLPWPPSQKFFDKFLHKIPIYWADVNNFILRYSTHITWDVQGLENLSINNWYLIICNHRSWADIFVLEYVLNRKIPTLKFFMKKELLWSLFLAGWAAALVDFPIMHRHSKAYLAKHPEQKGKDIEITRRACKKFKNIPTTVINFVEGTRFTPEKHQHQNSPYTHLLRPKSGGIAFALGAMGEYFNNILNITIVYPQDKVNLWDFFCGKVKKVVVRIESLPITPELLGDYENDRTYRVYFQGWMNGLWEQKDKLITEILAQNNMKVS